MKAYFSGMHSRSGRKKEGAPSRSDRRLPLDRLRSRMPHDHCAAKLEQILTEADDLIRRRLEESGLAVC